MARTTDPSSIPGPRRRGSYFLLGIASHHVRVPHESRGSRHMELFPVSQTCHSLSHLLLFSHTASSAWKFFANQQRPLPLLETSTHSWIQLSAGSSPSPLAWDIQCRSRLTSSGKPFPDLANGNIERPVTSEFHTWNGPLPLCTHAVDIQGSGSPEHFGCFFRHWRALHWLFHSQYLAHGKYLTK